MPPRTASTLLSLLLLLPTGWRLRASRPQPARACEPAGRASGDEAWVGCAADGRPDRDLSGRERVAWGLPVPLNRASARDLAEVPGLTPRLAAAIVANRAREGPFPTVDAIERVRGIGPKRLARARKRLIAE